MKTFLLICLLTVSLSRIAHAGDPVWNTGHVLLTNGELIRGQLSYNWKAEILQVRMPDGTQKTLSPHRVDSFVYYDGKLNALRKFSAIDMPATARMVRPVFMEELAVGYFTVYRRLRHTRELFKIARPSHYSNDDELIKDLDNFVYFTIDPEGKVTDLERFIPDLWPQMSRDYDDALNECLRARQLDTSSTVARLILINQYNYLREYAPTHANKPASTVIGND